MTIPSLPPCDVVIAPNKSVYVNGTLITNVSDFDLNVGHNAPIPEITLTFTPTSVVFGDIPKDTLDAAMMDMHPDDGTVDISRAIARAQARAAGLDPVRHTQPAPTPSAPPPPVRKDVGKVAEAIPETDAYPVDEEACSSRDTKSGRPCTRERGHVGSHRSY